jgi:hypothetical protein
LREAAAQERFSFVPPEQFSEPVVAKVRATSPAPISMAAKIVPNPVDD